MAAPARFFRHQGCPSLAHGPVNVYISSAGALWVDDSTVGARHDLYGSGSGTEASDPCCDSGEAERRPELKGLRERFDCWRVIERQSSYARNETVSIYRRSHILATVA